MKLLLPLLSFLLGHANTFVKEPTAAITQQVALHVRAITSILVSTVGSLALSCVGLSLFIASIAGQLDKNEEFHFTGGMGVYLALTVVSACVLAYSLRRETWMKALGFQTKPEPQRSEHKAGALENAVALLIMDFVEERQQRRHDEHPKADA
ncbi:hypothetical protein DOE51_04635 [Bdellovibrio sp. NC01]|nr:hypothetical protein DOE51_04635 [Bdellovibrio sp. NC01]